MIPTTGMEVVLIDCGEDGKTRLPVKAWADDGHPMVIGKQGLVRADSLGQVVQVDEGGDGLFHPVAAVPGGGWMMRDHTADAPMPAVPVIAWVVRADGTTTAVAPDGDGGLKDHEVYSTSRWTFYHPDTDTAVDSADLPAMHDQTITALQNYDWLLWNKGGLEGNDLYWPSDALGTRDGTYSIRELCRPGFTPATSAPQPPEATSGFESA